MILQNTLVRLPDDILASTVCQRSRQPVRRGPNRLQSGPRVRYAAALQWISDQRRASGSGPWRGSGKGLMTERTARNGGMPLQAVAEEAMSTRGALLATARARRR